MRCCFTLTVPEELPLNQPSLMVKYRSNGTYNSACRYGFASHSRERSLL